MDKKALLPGSGNYPQVPPQPETRLYRGFRPHKFLLNHADNTFFHEIWLYHHHHALDLYPDLEARISPNCPRAGLWTVQFAEAEDLLQEEDLLLPAVKIRTAKWDMRRTRCQNPKNMEPDEHCKAPPQGPGS